MANENLKNGPVNPDAENDEEMTVTLTLDDGTELECVVLTIFEAGEKEYIALLPLDGREAEDGEVYLYRYVEDINGNPDLENIDSDEEYEIVADAFDELLDSAEYDELVSEDRGGIGAADKIKNGMQRGAGFFPAPAASHFVSRSF